MKALTTRRFSHGGKDYTANQVIEVTEGQFADWQAAGLLTKAPEKEIKLKAEPAAK